MGGWKRKSVLMNSKENIVAPLLANAVATDTSGVSPTPLKRRIPRIVVEQFSQSGPCPACGPLSCCCSGFIFTFKESESEPSVLRKTELQNTSPILEGTWARSGLCFDCQCLGIGGEEVAVLRDPNDRSFLLLMRTETECLITTTHLERLHSDGTPYSLAEIETDCCPGCWCCELHPSVKQPITKEFRPFQVTVREVR